MAVVAGLTHPADAAHPERPPRSGRGTGRPLAPALGLAAVGYVVAAVVLLWPAVSSCTTVVYGPRGDATAGGLRLAWTFQQLGGGPFTGWTPWTGAPGGEAFWAPHWWTATAVFVPLWAFSTLTTAACAWNLTALTGLVGSALAAFALAAAVVRHRGVAFVAGLAWGFSAFHQMKAQAHLGYVHAQVLPLLVLALLALWRRPTVGRGAVAGLLGALAAMTDPYYLLLAPVAGAAVVGGLLVAGRRRRGGPLAPRARALAVALAVAAAALAPVAVVLVAHRAEGAALVERGPDDEVSLWTASLSDYLLWPRAHPVLGDVAADWRDAHLLGNESEKTLSLGFVALGLAALGAGRGLRRDRDRPTPIGLPLGTVTTALVALAAVGVWASLPPALPLPGLSVLHAVAPWWRVYARFGMVAHLGVAVLAAVGLALLVEGRRPRVRTAAVVGVAGVVLFESLTVPAATFDLRDAPEGYRWLAAQADVATIAEYPLDSPRRTPDNPFLSFQPVHGKRLLNATLPTSASVPLQEALLGLGDPQTPGVLAALGVDRVVVHRLLYPGLSGSGALPAGFRLVHSTVDAVPPAATAQGRIDRAYASMEVLALDPGVRPAEVAVGVGAGFDPPDHKGWSSVAWSPGAGRLPVVDLGPPTPRARVSFVVRSAVGAEEVAVAEGDRVLWHGRVEDSAPVPVSVEVAPGTALEVRAEGPPPPGGGIRVGVERLSAEPLEGGAP